LKPKKMTGSGTKELSIAAILCWWLNFYVDLVFRVDFDSDPNPKAFGFGSGAERSRIRIRIGLKNRIRIQIRIRKKSFGSPTPDGTRQKAI